MNTIPRSHGQEIVPRGMEQYDQFILCKVIPDATRPGKTVKLPCDIHGTTVSALERRNWMSAATAIETAARHGLRVGFVFAECDPFWFIDLDGCYDPKTGLWSPLALAIEAHFPGCAREISNSGTGLHLFGSGDVPEHRKRTSDIEFYTEGRFVLLTGTAAGGDARGDYTAHMPAFIAVHGLEPAPEPDIEVIRATGTAPGANPYADDVELIARMCESAGSGAVQGGLKPHPRDLWTGNAEALGHFYPHPSNPWDRSRADAALVASLYYWTGGDIGRTERLFLQSAIARPDHYARRPALMSRVLGLGCRGVQDFHNKDFRSGMKSTLPPGFVPTPPNQQPEQMPVAIDVAEMLRTPAPDREWSVNGWIPHKQVTLIAGDGGVGKTTILMQLALAMSCCRPWLGMMTTQHKVLFVSGEDERDELHYRFQEVARAMAVDARGVMLMTLDGLNSPELVTFEGDEIRVQPIFEHIVEIIRANCIGAVILDPVADLFGGDEIKRRQVRAFIGLLRKRLAVPLNCSVVLSAHPSVDAMKTKRGFSGSTAWNNSVRSRLYFTSDEENPDLRTLIVAKANRGKTGSEISMSWHNGVFVANETVEKTEDTTTDDQLKLIRRACVGRYRESSRAGDAWVGKPLGRVMGIDSDTPKGKSYLIAMIKKLVKTGIFEISDERKATGNKEIVSFIRVVDSHDREDT